MLATDQPIHVVAGIIEDASGRVLLAQRLAGTHLAGSWEFPGGKVEAGETAEAALRRELHEELGIDIGVVEPLIAVPWSYAEKSIVLHAYCVRDFHGEPRGRQQQALQWIAIDDMHGVPMPPADRPIVTALRLPETYAITPDLPGRELLACVEALGARGQRLIQLRSKRLPRAQLAAIVARAREIARRAGSALLLNDNVDLARELDVDGVHLPAARLRQIAARPLERPRWVAASCHDADELAQAAAVGVDFVVLGPVQATTSHPQMQPLGWELFSRLCAGTPLPVYALGGMSAADIERARRAGARGIAGISAFLR